MKRRDSEERQNRIKTARIISVSVFLTVIILGFAYIFTKSKVTTVYVDGNVHYSDEEITNMVTEGRLGNNTIYLFLKYRNKDIKDIPFIETMSVSIESADTVRISVYEKTFAGYVEYLGTNMYFDKDGYVVECSEVKTEGIPQVMGLYFDHVVLNQKLPVASDEIFQEILRITQMLTKYKLMTDKIYFDNEMNLSLYFDRVRIDIGQDKYLEEKLMVLPDILPKLAGQDGHLNLTEYTKGDTITFEQNER